MNIYDFMMVLQLLVVLAIFVAKFYNVMSVGRAFDMRWNFILFVGYFIAWGFGMVVLMLKPENLLFGAFFKLETWFIGIIVLFFIAEILLNINAFAKKPIQPFRSIDTGKQIDYFRRENQN